MEKMKYVLMMTEDGTRDGNGIATMDVYCDAYPRVGDTVMVQKRGVGCLGKITEISHLIDDEEQDTVYAICKFTGSKRIKKEKL
ncbi:MAG: hypothetical protein J6S14_15810 [Clostridia bacterium]|nr:hypothetical protein [Clostridia bacterium]